jgi:hypothetical protein
MPYPLPQQPRTVGGQRVRLLPPVGCPGVEQWVLPMEFSRWAELGYRKGPIPADDLELFWLPADSRWNEPIGTGGVIQPLIPSGGISGEPYDGRHAVVWWLRLHPNGGLGFMPDPSSGEPALAVVQESGVGSRATRWYSGDGPPPETLEPPPAVGDFYLDRLSGQAYELTA